ncbi:hypothetical protein [Oceanobacillus sp. CAU 1775]
MDKDLNQRPEDEKEPRVEEQELNTGQNDTVNEHASTQKAEFTHYEERAIDETSMENIEMKTKSSDSKKINFDFEKSLDETKGIWKDAILRPHSLIKSTRTISIETSIIIFVVLSILIGVVAYFAYRGYLDAVTGGLGGLFAPDVGISFMFQTMIGWLITFAVGYFSLYFMLQFFGNNKMKHKALLTKYTLVNIPFALVFCLIFILFGFLLLDYFFVMYIFGLMLFGMIHVYLFLVNIDKPKYDLFWLISGYLLVLIILTYLVSGINIPGF